jgi:5-methylcytosine-specific restriction endonuclease McrA
VLGGWFDWGRSRTALAAIETQRSSRWPKVRDAFARGKSCAACGTRSSIEVHHLQPFHLVPLLELEVSNLVALCRSCHLVFGHLHSWESHNPACLNDAAAHLAQVRGRP